MKLASLILALCGFATGIRAAWIWRKASKVPINPEIVPDDPVYGTMVWAESTKTTFKKAGALNAKAAAWTAASVAINALAAVVGVVSN
jgi:hypothetical protein